MLKQNFIERGYEENILNDEIDKVDNIDRKDLLSKKEKNIKHITTSLITYNRKLPMMRKIINKHWNVLQINPGLEKIFQNNLFVAYKRNKTLQEIMGGHRIKNGKVFKGHSKSREKNGNLATQVNHHYVESRLLTLVHFKVTKHSNYAPYFTN